MTEKYNFQNDKLASSLISKMVDFINKGEHKKLQLEEEKKEGNDTMFRREQNNKYYSNKIKLEEKPVILEEQEEKKENTYKVNGAIINNKFYTNEQLLTINLSEKSKNNIQDKFQTEKQTVYKYNNDFYTPEEFFLLVDKGLCKESEGTKIDRVIEVPVEFEESYIWQGKYYTKDEIDLMAEKNILHLSEVKSGIKVIPKKQAIKKEDEGKDISIIALEAREKTFEDARKQKYIQNKQARREREEKIKEMIELEEQAKKEFIEKRQSGCMF